MSIKGIIYLTLCLVLIKNQSIYSQSPSANDVDTIMCQKLIQPPYLKVGDTVAIVSPSGILNNKEEKIKQAIGLLESWGLHVVVGKNVFNRNNQFAGTDEARAEDLQKALDDPTISAIWCSRGGYGAVRVLDKLDYTKFKQNPKWLIGYSDITGFHNQIHNLGYETIHGIMAVSLADDITEVQDNVNSFKDAIFGKPLSYTIAGSEYNKPGIATGQLVGGNLTLIHTMLGSKTSIDTSGKILFFEEVGEYAYHVDRMLQSLKRAGYFENCKGIIVGDISKVRENTTDWGKPMEQLILDVLEGYNFPVLFNFPAGHEKENRSMILGRNIELHVGKDESIVNFQY